MSSVLQASFKWRKQAYPKRLEETWISILQMYSVVMGTKMVSDVKKILS